MDRSEANDLYDKNWDMAFTNSEELFARIKTLASLGCYEMCLYVDSNRTYDEVYSLLVEAGYDVEDYIGGGNGYLSVSWG